MKPVILIRDNDVLTLTGAEFKQALTEHATEVSRLVIEAERKMREEAADKKKELDSDQATAYCNLKSKRYFLMEYGKSGLAYTPGNPNWYTVENLDKFKKGRERVGSKQPR